MSFTKLFYFLYEKYYNIQGSEINVVKDLINSFAFFQTRCKCDLDVNKVWNMYYLLNNYIQRKFGCT